jgi:hypothetical protein
MCLCPCVDVYCLLICFALLINCSVLYLNVSWESSLQKSHKSSIPSWGLSLWAPPWPILVPVTCCWVWNFVLNLDISPSSKCLIHIFLPIKVVVTWTATTTKNTFDFLSKLFLSQSYPSHQFSHYPGIQTISWSFTSIPLPISIFFPLSSE